MGKKEHRRNASVIDNSAALVHRMLLTITVTMIIGLTFRAAIAVFVSHCHRTQPIRRNGVYGVCAIRAVTLPKSAVTTRVRFHTIYTKLGIIYCTFPQNLIIHPHLAQRSILPPSTFLLRQPIPKAPVPRPNVLLPQDTHDYLRLLHIEGQAPLPA